MAATRYFITDSNGIFINWYSRLLGLETVNQQLLLSGNSGVDSVYVGAGTQVDATVLSSGDDNIYLTGNFADYTQSIVGNQFTFSRVIDGFTESVSFVSAFGENDRLFFADGSVNTGFDNLFETSAFRRIVVGDLDGGEVTPGFPGLNIPVQSAANATRVFITDPAGETVAAGIRGSIFIVAGNSGIDKVLVGEGTQVNATVLGAGRDEIYLQGNFADYTQSVNNNEYLFTREIRGNTESLQFVVDFAQADVVFFADGNVEIRFADLLEGDSFRLITSSDVSGDGTPTPTPIVESTLTPLLQPVISGNTGSGAGLASGESLTVSVNGATYIVTPAFDGTWSVNLALSVPVSGSLASFDDGASYDVSAAITAADGNVRTDASISEVVIDRTAPVFSSGAGASVVENSAIDTVVYNAEASDNAGTVDANLTYALSGTDADALNIDINNGEVTLKNIADAESKAGYVFDVIATDRAGNDTTQNVMLAAQDIAELPSWIVNASEYGSSDTGISEGIHSLLDSDADNDLGIESHWAGKSSFNTGASLTYSYVGRFGYINPNASLALTFSSSSFSSTATTFIDGVFDSVAAFADITFRRVSDSGSRGGGGDIRLSVSSASSLGLSAGTSTLAFAYQAQDVGAISPSESTRHSTLNAIGDIFVVSERLPSNPYSNSFGEERSTITHELGHALGLDHPFNSRGGSSAGFYGYTDDNGGVDYGGAGLANNYSGVRTGGGHQTAVTDTVIETLLTYHNPYDTFGNINVNFGGSVGVVTAVATANAPWQLGIQDVAALQHLYGANLNTNADDTTYTYSSDNQVWDTIWDGGGHDTIVHEGRFDAYIDLNEGAVSHLGFHGGTSFTYTASDFGTGRAFNASNSGFSESSDGLVKVAADGSTLTYWLNQGPNGIDDSYRLNVEFIDGDSFFVDITSLSAIDTSFITGNVGIAYGVTIEDAIGGDGDDVLIGNRAANTLRGGLGDDSYTGGGNADTFLIEADFGMDEILDFEKGLDQLVFSGFASADVSVAESAGDTVFTDTFGNSVTVAGVTDLVFATDYNYVVV